MYPQSILLSKNITIFHLTKTPKIEADSEPSFTKNYKTRINNDYLTAFQPSGQSLLEYDKHPFLMTPTPGFR